MKKSLLIIPLLVFGLVGCSEGDTTNTQEQTNTQNQKPKQEETQVVENKKEIVEFAIYRSDSNAENLIKENLTAEIDTSSQKIQQEIAKESILAMVKLLKTSPTNNQQELYSTIPENVELLDVELTDDKVLYLNLNEESMYIPGSTGQLMFMDSLTKTIFDNTDEELFNLIKFKVEGQEVDILGDLSVKDGVKR